MIKNLLKTILPVRRLELYNKESSFFSVILGVIFFYFGYYIFSVYMFVTAIFLGIGLEKFKFDKQDLKIEHYKIEHEIFDENLKNIVPAGETPLDVMKNLMENFEITHHPDSRFIGGFVGYFSYDLVRHIITLEDIPDELNEPDCEFMLAKNNVVVDTRKGKFS